MTEETSKISDEEFQALQATLNNDHLTKIVNGNPALVVKHDLISVGENLEIDDQVLLEINSKFSEKLQEGLASVLNTYTKIFNLRTEVEIYSKYIRNIVPQSAIITLSLQPMERHALVTISSSLVFNSLDRFFGGAGSSTIGFSTDRNFASTEDAILGIMCTLISSSLSEGWAPLAQAKFEKIQSELDPNKLRGFKYDESLIITRFDVSTAEGIEGQIVIAYPITSIRSHVERYAKQLLDFVQLSSINKDWTRELRQRCMDVDIELEVEFGKIHSTVGEIASLSVGDELKIVTGEVLAITVDGVSIVYGMPGQLGESVAVKVTAPSDR